MELRLDLLERLPDQDNHRCKPGPNFSKTRSWEPVIGLNPGAYGTGGVRRDLQKYLLL
jgi:hypothetical protein